ncbi:uncharacterized protein PFL1_05790 [Pseudozyma flocculosa PF-1]|uniref:Related to Myosin regulatory light chain 2-A, smooth muscle isoform n=2 Tax=Pseudozyma flocculosa TaxID=84751 RepID=A0A5C3F9U2_9BASI|nr:uncharacterized protein PFL1_05790 [Pseudozyma flocculosa PF-1]EPQ26812.1 hypothetical protein PFL1_05790 [Pseudozyma flocculosa PF-1]SPO40856.1 related to Myosin regulatory light chain 2-A, smooth muscle isoform [Pseudozyma flocculosa]
MSGPSTLLNPAARSNAVSQLRATSALKGNHPRQSSSSGVYNTFSPKQIQGFKEAFNMIDQDGDGLISRADLAGMLQNLGQEPKPSTLDAHFASAGSSSSSSGSASATINFTQFLTMFGEHLAELDEASTLVDAFECFDERDQGVIDAGEIRYWLSEVGDRMTEQEIDRLLSGPFTDRSGKNFDYKAFVEAIKMSEPAELE